MNANTTTIERRGNIVGDRSVLDALPRSAARIRTWDDGTMRKTKEAIYAVARTQGIQIESVFDAAHGFRYMAFAYRLQDERRTIWSFLTGADE